MWGRGGGVLHGHTVDDPGPRRSQHAPTLHLLHPAPQESCGYDLDELRLKELEYLHASLCGSLQDPDCRAYVS